MANLGLHTGGLPRGELLGRYRSYEEAQKVVDHLASAQGFDLRAITIVGNDLRSVEKIRGRLSYPRVALTGAVQGALFGAFMGLLLMLFAPEGMVLLNFGMAVLMGMAIWMIIGVISFSARRGTRGFISASQLTATTFDVVCDFQAAGKARQLVQGTGVTSLNAVNDPTGKSTNLDAAAQRQSERSAPVSNTTTPAQESAPESGEQGQHPEQAASSSSETPQSDWVQPDGKPRYGVRLADLQREDRAAEEPEGQQSAEVAPESAERPGAQDSEQR